MKSIVEKQEELVRDLTQVGIILCKSKVRRWLTEFADAVRVPRKEFCRGCGCYTNNTIDFYDSPAYFCKDCLKEIKGEKKGSSFSVFFKRLRNPTCLNCGKKMTPAFDKVAGRETGYSWKCECMPNKVLSIL